MTNFERTLSLIESMLMSRLRPEYRNIWVQGSNRPNSTTILFTVFGNQTYRMHFVNIKNFRQFRPDATDQNLEMEILRGHIESMRPTLNEFINFDNES